ncbi:MAG: 2-amino-4-hydroxy-6-hydroxymethyldihydropteridine diphosphokinase [Nocardioides sp.]
MTETPNPHLVDADTITGEMHPIRRIVLSLGSNVGDRLASLQGAVTALADTPDLWLTAVSPVYETEPVDSPPDAGLFLNAVVLADTTLPAHRLLDRALAIEDAFERVRTEEVNAPRTLDIDVIVVGDRRCQDDALVLPTPGRPPAASCCGRGTTSSRTPSSPMPGRSPSCSTPWARTASYAATTSSSRCRDRAMTGQPRTLRAPHQTSHPTAP